MKTPHSTPRAICAPAYWSLAQASERSKAPEDRRTPKRWCIVWKLLALAILHSAFVISPHAAEPTRQELWVPTKDLDTVLKAQPNAVMLSPEQYGTLIRDAGKTKAEEDPKLAPPKIIAIEGLRLDGKVEPGAASVTLRGELTLQLPSKEWLSTKIAWPFEMGGVTSEGSVLAYVEPPKNGKTTGVRELIVFAKGPGVAKLRFEAVVPVWLRLRAGEHTLEVPEVPFGGVLNLTLPAGVRLLAGSAYERKGDTIQVAFDHRGYDDSESSIQRGAARAFRVRWIEAPPEAAPQPWAFSKTAQATFTVTESNVEALVVFGMRHLGGESGEAVSTMQLTGKDTQVTSVTGSSVRKWRQENGLLSVTLERDGGMQDVSIGLRRPVNSIADAGELPLLVLNLPLRTRASINLALAPDIEILDYVNVKQIVDHPRESTGRQLDQFEFQLGVDQPRLVLRTSKPRIESDVDVIARIDKDSVQIERRLALRSDRAVTEIKVTLPLEEEFIAILSMPRQVSERDRALQLLANATTAVPNLTTWRRVGQTIALLPAGSIDPEHPLELSITSRLKLTKAWTGPKNPEMITVRQLDIPEAVKVAGYTALDFDDAWRVALKEAKGLEDRDARLTPVKGRMAWFGLREHALTFEVERAEAVFSTEVTAYALPRARTIEIEGQFALDISGAPLRSFQVRLPVENAKLLRVTSPLVGEQQLDETTGTWTFTLRQESKGRRNVRWRMSLPSATGSSADKTITATLPHLELPQSRRFAGTWIIEANTDTQLSTKMQNMQPLDVLRVPVVAGYQPRHRVTSAFTYGAGDNALTIMAQRHAHSELAALVVNRMGLVSVLGTDGHSLHEVTLDLSHSGEQFVSLHLPQNAELLSTSSGGQAVKPVRGVENAVAIPLPAGSANAPHTLVQVQYRQQNTPWSGSGTQNLEPVRIVGSVPVLSTDWAVYAPAAFGYGKVNTTLEQPHVAEDADDFGFLARLALVLRKPLEWGASQKTMGDRETASRSTSVEDARTAMDRGDQWFREGDYEQALSSYKAAVDSLPNAPETEDWLNLARLKQADCSVAVAQERAKQGNYGGARQLLNEALLLVPGHKGSTVMLQQLEDPDRWPPALTSEGMKVQQGLLLANSSVEIGNYDDAISQYQDVLRTDPYNSAARRGMENAERRRQNYFKTAYDHQRSKMLAQVREQWEDKVPMQAGVAGDYGTGRSPGAYLTEKMNRIIFPTVQFQDTPIEEAIEYLRVKSRDLDTFTDASGVKGVNIILRMGATPANARITLDLKDVPMSEALRYVTELADMKYRVEAHAVLVVPLSENASEQFTRSYRVPPDFLTASGIAHPTAKKVLEAAGVVFPEGANASYNPASSQLVVRNTLPNLDLVEALVESLANQAPPPPADSSVVFDYGVGRSPGAYLTEKMNKIIIPSVQFNSATMEQALEYLRAKSRELDTFTDPGGARGVNIILKHGDGPSNASISLDLKDVPLSEALRYVTELAQMKYKVEAHAVLVVPLSENASEQFTRSYRVPPDFLSSMQTSMQGEAAPADPFAAGASAAGSALVTRITAKQVLEAAGIVFPEGASASYNPATSQIVVRNTQPNLDLMETFVTSVPKKSGRLFASIDEMQFKSGLIPLDVTLPETGRVLRFHGAQAPEMLALHYTSWSQQMVRAVLGMAVGMVLFWRCGRRRPWFLTLLVVVVIAWGVPLVLHGALLALANAAAFGWFCALVLQALGWLFACSRAGTEPEGNGARSLTTSLRSFVLRHSVFVLLFTLTPALQAETPPTDPAAHTVIIPYDAKLPLDAQKAERFYLGYEEFQRLWKLAKENRSPQPAETDATQHAVIHSALYQGRIEERGLLLEARITATTRGEWTKLRLPFAQIENGKDTTKALVGEVRVDGKSAALSNDLLTLEHPGTHVIELTATLPLSQAWNELTLRLPPALSGMLALHTPKSDGWLRVNGTAAATVEERADGRLFTQTLGTHREMQLQRSARGLERGEGPVPAATVRGTLTLGELEPEILDANVEFEFPGAVRRTLEFAVDAPAGGGGLEIGSLNIYTTLPSAGRVRVPVMTSQTRREGGRLLFTITLRHEVSHGAVMHIQGAQRFLHAPGVRTMPVIQPLAQRVKQEMALLHDESMKIKVNGGAAQRSTNSGHGTLLDAGRWQWSGTAAPTYDVQPAALFAEADVSYVFQLTEQKAELLAALTLKRKRGAWTRAVAGLPAGYEVQAAQGPAVTAWQHEGAQLYLQLNPNIAGPEARVVVHLARVATQPVTTWTLEPLKLENYEKVGGKALIVAHAANEVKLPDLTQRKVLKELDATVLDSVFAIAPPMEKKRALQHEGMAWSVGVTLTRQAARFAADTVLLVQASDAGIRVSQQVVAQVEQGAVRQISVRLSAALPEAVVSGPLLRETRSRIDGAERVYECSLQTEVLDRAELIFDLDLPLTAELDVPFVKVAGTSRLTRWFVLDNASAREAKITTQTALEEVAREAVPSLPAGLARAKFFRATGDGVLKLAYQQLTSTEGNAALITLADLTTVLRADGTRWDIAQYSLINRTLQFLPVILPDHAELISASVSGEPVRADEETQHGKRVRLIPLIHTRPGQRALEVKMIYRFTQSGGLQHAAKLDDPEIVGLSVERTTWTVWTPQGWNLKDFDGNMSATAAEGREMLQLEGMLSELGEANRALSSGKLEYSDAAAAYRDANALAHKVQVKKNEIMSKMGRGYLSLDSLRAEPGKLDQEIQQQGQLLQGNWDNNYANRQTTAKGGINAGQIEQGKTSWGLNGSAPQEEQLRLSGTNTFSGSVTINGGQLFNDNVAVDNSYFAGGGPITAGNRYGGFTIKPTSIDNLLTTGSSQTSQVLTQNATGSVNIANSNARSNSLANGGRMDVSQGVARDSAGNLSATISPPGSFIHNQGSLANGSGLSNSGKNDFALRGRGELGFAGPSMKPSMPAMGGDPFGAPPPPVSGSFGMNDVQQLSLGANTNLSPVPAAAAPAMGNDPFGAPADLPAKEDAIRKATPVADDEGKEQRHSLAQTVESLRPTGRRALGIDLPLDGTAHHFSKLKDHAVLEIALKRVGDPKTTSRLLCLTGGLLLWLAIGWRLKRRGRVAYPCVTNTSRKRPSYLPPA